MLPKIEHPTFSVDVPTHGRKIRLRPFLVAEEKILLAAKQNDEPMADRRAITQVINNCLVEEFDVRTLALIDLEWIWIQLRMNSVSDLIELVYVDMGDDKEYPVAVNLSDIEIPDVSKVDRLVKLDDKRSLRLKFPPAHIFSEDVDEDDVLHMCAEAIVEGDNITPVDTTKEEFTAWYDTLPLSVSEGVQAFFDSLPRVTYSTSYKNSNGEERKVVLRGLSDFFELR